MTCNITPAQSQKEMNKIIQQQQSQQLQSQLAGSANINQVTNISSQLTIGGQQTTSNISTSLNTQSPLLTSNIQQKKISQRIQLKVPMQANGQSQSVAINTLMNSSSINQQINQQQQNNLQTTTTGIQQQFQYQNCNPSTTLSVNQQSIQQTAACQQFQQAQNFQQSLTSSSASSSYSLQSQMSSQNSLQNCSISSNPNSEQQLNQQMYQSFQHPHHNVVYHNHHQQLHYNQNQSIYGAAAPTTGNGSGQHCSQFSASNSANTSMIIKKPSGVNAEDNGIYFSQKKKLLQIIQKQQREQQEFEKQQQQAITGTSSIPQTPEEIMQEVVKSHRRSNFTVKPLKVITSPKTKNTCFRNLLKKYQRNIGREENLTSLNTSSVSLFMAPQLSMQQTQSNGNMLQQICLSPLKRPVNGMTKDEKFTKYASIPQGKSNNSVNLLSNEQLLTQQINKDEDKKYEESIQKQEQLEQIEDSLQDNFDQYHKLLDEEDLIFMKEIEDVCCQNQQYPIEGISSCKILYNKNFNKQISSSTSSQQSISQGISPSNTQNSKLVNESSSAINFSQHTKENDCPKVKESNFKRIVKTNVSISQNPNNPVQQSQQPISQNQKPAISQILNWFDNSFEKKNNRSNSEFQWLETEDSLATTHLSALSNCTPHSVSQNILTLFSPHTNSSAGSTIDFNHTNNSLKQAIKSLSWQNGDNSTLIFEQIKQQIDQQKQQLHQQQQLQTFSGQDTEIVSEKQIYTKNNIQELQANQQIEGSKKIKVICTQTAKNSIQAIINKNIN